MFCQFIYSDLREDVCYGSVSSRGCEKPYGGRYKKVDCCCSVVGGGWGNPCQECPLENTGVVKNVVSLFTLSSIFSHVSIYYYIYIILSILDEFEGLCGHRTKGYKSVDTLTGPRVQGLYKLVF